MGITSQAVVAKITMTWRALIRNNNRLSLLCKRSKVTSHSWWHHAMPFRFTCAASSAQVNRIAHALHTSGMSKSDRINTYLPHCMEILPCGLEPRICPTLPYHSNCELDHYIVET